MEYGILDIGNTFIKLYSKNQDFKLLFKEKKWDEKKINFFLQKFQKTIISNVRYKNEELFELLKLVQKEKYIILNSETKIPIKLDYETPKTLGKDRISTAVAAFKLFPVSNCLIFDIGSCMTIDFLDKNGVFKGGRISPGINMRLKAMNHFTGKLPLPSVSDRISQIEKNTDTNLQSGAFYGLLYEIEGTIEYFKKRYESINIILTGGDAHLFDKRLKSSIFADSFFLLKGLEFILQHNDEN